MSFSSESLKSPENKKDDDRVTAALNAIVFFIILENIFIYLVGDLVMKEFLWNFSEVGYLRKFYVEFCD